MTDSFDPNQEKRVKRARKEEELEKLDELSDLRAVLKLEAGRNVIRRILKAAGYRQSSFALNNSQMCFNEGQRNLGQWLEASVIKADIESYFQIIRDEEKQESRKSNDE